MLRLQLRWYSTEPLHINMWCAHNCASCAIWKWHPLRRSSSAQSQNWSSPTRRSLRCYMVFPPERVLLQRQCTAAEDDRRATYTDFPQLVAVAIRHRVERGRTSDLLALEDRYLVAGSNLTMAEKMCSQWTRCRTAKIGRASCRE